MRFAFKSEVIVVNSRGNQNSDILSYPSTYYPGWQTGDDWVISCGGSDKTGERFVINPSTGSNYGSNLDVIAPGTSNIVYTTNNNNQNDYSSFGGTSAAAPHVTGLACLLMSYANH